MNSPKLPELWDKVVALRKDHATVQCKEIMTAHTKWQVHNLKNGNLNVNNLWRSMKGPKQQTNLVLRNEDGQVLNDAQRKGAVEDHFRELGRKDDTTNQTHSEHSYATNITKENTSQAPSHGKGIEICEPVTEKEVQTHIKVLKNAKATLEDDIPNEFLKMGGTEMTKALVRIFNIILAESNPPTAWSKETITLIHKGGDKGDIGNYRGIAITSTIGKLFSRVMAARLLRTAEIEGWLPEHQNAFRKSRGTQDNLLIIEALMEQARKKKRPIAMAFMDWSKAYDRVWRDELWRTLRKTGLGEKSVNVIRNLYLNTTRRISLPEGYSDWLPSDAGMFLVTNSVCLIYSRPG
jgi:hypothetical protein